MEETAILNRNPEKLAGEKFDVIVIGGGIYGACLLLEASRRGMKALVLERDDFGGATSWNSLRIIHGGLRYLQNADLGRFHRSVAEQSWWLKHFPDIVEPMSCLMPLYDKGLRRRDVMGCALRINDWLANRIRKRYGDAVVAAMPASQIISAEATVERFEQVHQAGLTGGAVWYDAKLQSPQRLMMELLRWSATVGGNALNYMNCTELIQDGGRVVGVTAECAESNVSYEFQADYVVNCAGPWAGDWLSNRSTSNRNEANSTQRDFAVAFNLVLNRPPLSNDALAITAKGGENTYFFVPHQERTMVGTVHLPPSEADQPTSTDLSEFLNELCNCASDLTVLEGDVSQILGGRLPPDSIGSHLPKKSPKIGFAKDPLGLISVEGVKYTTARFVAEQTLSKIVRIQGRSLPGYATSHRPPPNVRVATDLTAHDLQKLIQTECVMHLDDLLLRRTDYSDSREELLRRGNEIAKMLNWEESRQKSEMMRLRNIVTTLFS